MKTPVTIRGVSYPSKRAAARALGHSAALICYHERRGTLDRIGVGPGVARRKPITIEGVEFESQSEAAACLDVNTYAISNYLSVLRKIEEFRLELEGGS